MAAQDKGPHWQLPGARGVHIDPAKPKAARDYIGEATTALAQAMPLGTSIVQNRDILAAIIVAQALDRFGERLIDAAAVSQYKRTP